MPRVKIQPVKALGISELGLDSNSLHSDKKSIWSPNAVCIHYLLVAKRAASPKNTTPNTPLIWRQLAWKTAFRYDPNTYFRCFSNKRSQSPKYAEDALRHYGPPDILNSDQGS